MYILRVLIIAFILFIQAALTFARDIPEEDTVDYVALIKKYANWRQAWGFELSAIPDSAVSIPDSVIITLTNNSQENLQGSGLYFIIVGLDDYYHAHNDILSDKEILLSPGETQSYRLAFRSLAFMGIYNLAIDTIQLFSQMRAAQWSLKATLTDIWSTKPPNESSWLVRSNPIDFRPCKLDIDKDDK
ncbi:MAG: hypothetical protein PHU88_05410 [candidate division Zixibacteria bacterium]|nr:hypothetical protein [candidate division Zixibacteria bacterium]MDD5426595.1 hypothetical protein [candidate division Zixibacteria bacterium]